MDLTVSKEQMSIEVCMTRAIKIIVCFFIMHVSFLCSFAYTEEIDSDEVVAEVQEESITETGLVNVVELDEYNQIQSLIISDRMYKVADNVKCTLQSTHTTSCTNVFVVGNQVVFHHIDDIIYEVEKSDDEPETVVEVEKQPGENHSVIKNVDGVWKN